MKILPFLSKIAVLLLVLMMPVMSGCTPKQGALMNASSFGFGSLQAQPNSGVVKFHKLKVQSLDQFFVEVKALDREIVQSRNALQKSHLALKQLSKGDSLSAEIQKLIRKRKLTLTRNEMGLPKLTAASGHVRANQIAKSVNQLSRQIKKVSKNLPEMIQQAQHLGVQSKSLISDAPNDIKKAIANGRIPANQFAGTMLKTNQNLGQVVTVIHHANELKNNVQSNSKDLKNLLGM